MLTEIKVNKGGKTYKESYSYNDHGGLERNIDSKGDEYERTYNTDEYSGNYMLIEVKKNGEIEEEYTYEKGEIKGYQRWDREITMEKGKIYDDEESYRINNVIYKKDKYGEYKKIEGRERTVEYSDRYGIDLEYYKTYNGVEKEKYTEDKWRNIIKVEYENNGEREGEYRYTYDERNRLSKAEYGELYREYDYSIEKQISERIPGYNYSKKERYSEQTGRYEGTDYEIGSSKKWSYGVEYSSKIKGEVSNENDGSYRTEYIYNEDGTVGEEVLKAAGKEISRKKYTYRTREEGGIVYRDGRISKVREETGSTVNERIYSYDSRGNITSIINNGIEEVKYGYDSKGRLIKEIIGTEETVYEYDGENNIRKVTKKEKGSERIIKEEIYNNTGLRLNKITTVENGESMERNYVMEGHNYSDYGGVSLNWTEGTRLESSVKNGITTSYKYDDRGLRYEKTTEKNGRNETIKYYYDGDKLIAEENSNGIKTYHYSGNRPIGINVYGTYYVLITNEQGDVTEVRNISGVLRASYRYDAWGNCKIEGNESVGDYNRLRYRGYYLDSETGYYYLQNRYYDPKTRRFISADSVELEPELALSGQDNLYTYCSNNPVNMTDSTGMMPEWLSKTLGWLTTAALVVGAGVMIGLVAVGTVATGGLLAPVLVGAGVGIIAGVAGSIAVQGGLSNIGNINPWSVAAAGAIGGAIGAFSGAMSYGFAQVGQFAGQFIGMSLSNLPVLASISTPALTTAFMSAGFALGGLVGGFIGGMTANHMANKLVSDIFGPQYMVDNPNWARSGLLQFFKWLNAFA